MSLPDFNGLKKLNGIINTEFGYGSSAGSLGDQTPTEAPMLVERKSPTIDNLKLARIVVQQLKPVLQLMSMNGNLMNILKKPFL